MHDSFWARGGQESGHVFLGDKDSPRLLCFQSDGSIKDPTDKPECDSKDTSGNESPHGHTRTHACDTRTHTGRKIQQTNSDAPVFRDSLLFRIPNILSSVLFLVFPKPDPTFFLFFCISYLFFVQIFMRPVLFFPFPLYFFLPTYCLFCCLSNYNKPKIQNFLLNF